MTLHRNWKTIVAFTALFAGLGSNASTQEVITSTTYIDTPPPQQQVITPAPGPSYVWVPGRWDRTPDSWSWVAGSWVQPPFSNAYYVPGYWQNWGGKYQWEAGHWAAADQGYVVQKPVTVPPVYVEPQPAAPAGNFVWQPGHWEWRGTWVWVPGEYIANSQPRAVWVQGSWQATPAGTWAWNPAHWTLK
jgi:hypothetical protein